MESFVNRVQAPTEQGLEPPPYVQGVLQTIQQLNQQLKEADKELEPQAKADPVCRRPMSVPGVGPVPAMRFVATLDQVERVGEGAQEAWYLGVVPGENSSSERRRITGTTKAGSRQTRWALVQAAWSFVRWAQDDDPVRMWAMQVMQRRGKNVAVVALAHKLATILYALWRDGSRYRNHPVG